MLEILSSPLFGIALSIVAFIIGMWVNKKLKTPLANPLIIAMLLVVGFLSAFGIPVEVYEEGSSDRKSVV